MQKRALAIVALSAVAALIVLSSATAGLAIDKRKEAREQRRENSSQDLKVSETPVEGSVYGTYRVEAVLEVDVETAARAAMQILIDSSRAPENQVRTLVRSENNAFLIYTMIDVPFAADRDVLVRVEETHDVVSGSRGLVWHATEDQDVPPVSGVVRIGSSEGFWRFTPLPSGGTLAVYQNHTDVGGSIPGWLVRSMLREEAVDQIEILRAGLERAPLAPGDVAGAPPNPSARGQHP